MGNCWRMPEDHSGLLDIPSPHFASMPTSSTLPSSNSYLTFTHPVSSTSDTQTPKVRNIVCCLILFSFNNVLVNYIKSFIS